MWEQINRMYLFFFSGAAKRMFQNSTYEFFKWILEGSQLFQGVTDATMAHDEGWEFIRLGMFLERADRTSRILDIKYHILLPSGEQIGGNVDTVQWMAVLKSCSALEPYRKHYRGQVVPWKVVEFLVKNQTFPRSIVFCVDSLDHSLHEITGVDRGDFQYKVEAERLSGKLLADLCFVTIEEIFRIGLHEYLDRMQGRLIEISSRPSTKSSASGLKKTKAKGSLRRITSQRNSKSKGIESGVWSQDPGVRSCQMERHRVWAIFERLLAFRGVTDICVICASFRRNLSRATPELLIHLISLNPT